MIELFAVFGHVEDERTKYKFERIQHSLKITTRVDVHCSNQGLQNISKNFGWLKKLNVPLVEREVFLETVQDVFVYLTVHLLLQIFFALPVHFHLLRRLISYQSWLFKKNILMKASQHDQLGQEVVFSQMRLGLMGVKRPKVFGHYVFLSLSLLQVVFLKHRVPEKVTVCDVVQNCITENFQLFVAAREVVIVLELSVG